MFGQAWFGRKWFADEWFGKGAAAVAVVATVPGIEFTMSGQRLHYEAQADRLHYAAHGQRLHFEAPADRLHYVFGHRLHYVWEEE